MCIRGVYMYNQNYQEYQYSANVCSNCGRRLTVEEDSLCNPPTCIYCARDYIQGIRTEMIKSIVLSIVFMIAGIALIGNFSGVLLAGIPYGWALLNKMTSRFFMWLPIIGWLIYFLIKLVLSYFIGLIALPVKLIQWISKLSKANRIKKQLNIH